MLITAIIVFLVAWLALYILVIRPKLVAFRYTAGIYAELDAIEAGALAKASLWLKGLKVAIIGFVTSSAPVAAVFYERIAGLDWSQFLSSEKVKLVGLVVTVLGVVGPMLMVALHNGALADAAATEPQK